MEGRMRTRLERVEEEWNQTRRVERMDGLMVADQQTKRQRQQHQQRRQRHRQQHQQRRQQFGSFQREGIFFKR